MNSTHELKRRDFYLNKLIAFKDMEPVKVVTGACVKIGLNQEKPYK